jgi:hypothetical protein
MPPKAEQKGNQNVLGRQQKYHNYTADLIVISVFCCPRFTTTNSCIMIHYATAELGNIGCNKVTLRHYGLRRHKTAAGLSLLQDLYTRSLSTCFVSLLCSSTYICYSFRAVCITDVPLFSCAPRRRTLVWATLYRIGHAPCYMV